ncbi:MAG: hypothetical protein IKN27_00725 [Selenomonadaceae bacterium]|nr:hypothetical protein [Selenomonadaceae bacterium]
MTDTMTIKLELDKSTYRDFFDCVNEFLVSRGVRALWFDDTGKRYVTTKLSKQGFLEIAFHKTKFGRYLAVKLQPIRLLKENELVELCRFEDYFSVEKSFNEFWREVIGSEGDLPDFMKFANWMVSRIDYAFQFKTPYLQTYLDLLQRGRVDKYFSEREYETSVYATANTVNLNFYDKYAQLQSKSYLKASEIEAAKNILRLEVQCKADYLQKLRKKFKLAGISVRDFWNVDIAEHVLRYRIKMLVGDRDFYRMDEAERKLKTQAGNNAIILCLILRDIAQAENVQLAKENFCRKHSGVSREKWEKFLHRLRKKLAINPLTFSADAKLPPTLKNPCELLSEDFQRSKIISTR